jgi:hypothetical protein
MKKSAVFGVVSTRSDAEELVFDLLCEGFRDAEISVLLPSPGETRIVAIAHGTSSGAGGNLLAGMGLTELSMPDGRPLWAVGPIAGALGRAIDASAGSVAAGLTTIGVSHARALDYEEKIDGGLIFVAVHTDDASRVDLAKLIFVAAGADDIFATRPTGLPGMQRERRAPRP